MAEGENDVENRSHVLLLPYPSQGHIHPMLDFGKRLAFHGLQPTLATTRFILSSTNPDPGPVRIAPISDGFDRGGYYEINSVSAYLARLEITGSETLDNLLKSESADGKPVKVLVYDAFLPWAGEVARRNGVAAAAFFTQPCAVNVVYGHTWEKRVKVPVKTSPFVVPGLPALEHEDLPSFMLGAGPYPAYLEMVVAQFKYLHKADDVLVNSFYELEPEEAKYMESEWRGKTIGPTVPSSYLDNHLSSDTSYGFHLYTPTTTPCIAWLDSKPPHSVVYTSFGSLSCLDPAQMEEVAYGLYDCGKPFLWVVRSVEAHKIPENFAEKVRDRGYIVSWSPQLEVLAHEAVGCFFSHCGWNSTVEALVLGMPMVGIPQWTDQPMNAKYVEGVWKVGKRVKPDSGGLVKKEEIVRCISEVMEGERSEEYRRNAKTWREKAQEAMREGGSSYRNIAEFAAKYRAQ
ncbi:Glycosyltransferase [Rhynchospora pubera]|uniref:Glycosyltransferase n=1 Tax=Rhynchospora pubera TaxID=906938 RepID=A0AAV8G9I8_9POAL|nr:Glycosyltransferase [Rhynchospora pubera]